MSKIVKLGSLILSLLIGVLIWQNYQILSEVAQKQEFLVKQGAIKYCMKYISADKWKECKKEFWETSDAITGDRRIGWENFYMALQTEDRQDALFTKSPPDEDEVPVLGLIYSEK